MKFSNLWVRAARSIFYVLFSKASRTLISHLWGQHFIVSFSASSFTCLFLHVATLRFTNTSACSTRQEDKQTKWLECEALGKGRDWQTESTCKQKQPPLSPNLGCGSNMANVLIFLWEYRNSPFYVTFPCFNLLATNLDLFTNSTRTASQIIFPVVLTFSLSLSVCWGLHMDILLVP